MPILARRIYPGRMGAVVVAAPENPASGWLDQLDLWLLQNTNKYVGAVIGEVTGGANLYGTLSAGQKRALIQQETAQLVQAGMDPSSAYAQATYDVTGVLIKNNADPSQAGIATALQAPIDLALTGSVMPSGTIYDRVTGAGAPPDPQPPSWLSQNWMWLLGFGILGYVAYDQFA